MKNKFGKFSKIFGQWRRVLATMAIFVIAITSIVGCTTIFGTLTGEPQGYDYAVGAMVEETAVATMYKSSAANDVSYDYDAAVSEPMMMASATSDTVAISNSSSSSTSVNVDDGRKLVKTVSLSVETKTFDELVSSINAEVTALNGYIESSDISGNPMQDSDSRKSAMITARVPADTLDAFVGKVSDESNVTSKYEYVNDVTLRYSDIESHQKSLKTEQERLWELMAIAESMDAIITIQTRLSEIEYELESYESQLRIMDNQVDYATVNIDISEVKDLTIPAADTLGDRIKSGLGDSIENIIDATEDLIVGLISSLPVIVIVLVILLVLFVIARVVLKRLDAKMAAKASTEQSASEVDAIQEHTLVQ
jgi:hypothetical protein